MLPTVYDDEITEPTTVGDCGRSGPMVNTEIPMQAGNNVHYTAKEKEKKSCLCL